MQSIALKEFKAVRSTKQVCDELEFAVPSLPQSAVAESAVVCTLPEKISVTQAEISLVIAFLGDDIAALLNGNAQEVPSAAWAAQTPLAGDQLQTSAHHRRS